MKNDNPLFGLWQIDRYGRTCVTTLPQEGGAKDLSDIILDVSATPKFIAHPAAIQREFAKFD